MWVWSKLAALKWEDAWEERFYGNGNAVLTRLKGGRSVRVDVYCEEEGEALEIAAQFGGSVKEVADRNWAALSAVPGPPIKIRESLLLTAEVTPPGLRELLRLNEGRVVVSIPPEMAFGTGDHPTTAACLRFLADEARARKGGRWRMLDLGCGSGVLAIAANLLGAEECEALDFDRKAVEIARHNVERNGAHEVRVEEADLREWRVERQYEVVVANLFADVLQASFGKIRRTLGPGSAFILSGVLREQWPETEEAARTAGLAFEIVKKKGKWVSAKGGMA
ncbi:MAG: 50S ribosomal protein L11 methyltransferase [Roseibacillus sp.]|jgi:ribosomal protein L11 methyltransferase|nr:50S ribosomal protein L11 methyltransferase [Roseibacillus sp.]MBP36383.1 50S ribosomal protein L11 methyltransferase [Roseibacillus sp.]MCP4732417.1 methyltransferase domain-containing protein [Roseibacillus sp.]MDP7306111.1 50S ribosomal protein L11 methyltransferase [Roseibacillus sp.]MDP7495864.1 50S ribosomal protein L11 methyltransferase [Roseibacillus sp.]|tara:strand:+ start:15986 stop:16825 length:840 start_codon:yes stop_codon:yes gene_type:complete